MQMQNSQRLKVFSEEKNEPSENITEDTENETSTDETVSDKNLTESLDVDEEVKDGLLKKTVVYIIMKQEKSNRYYSRL